MEKKMKEIQRFVIKTLAALLCFIINCLMQFVYFNSMHWFIFLILSVVCLKMTQNDIKRAKLASLCHKLKKLSFTYCTLLFFI